MVLPNTLSSTISSSRIESLLSGSQDSPLRDDLGGVVPRESSVSANGQRQTHRKRRIRPGEEGTTPLQQLYDKQLRDQTWGADKDAMLATLVAVAWMPGRDRDVCPPVVDIRDPRVLVMDRFVNERYPHRFRIGLAMHKVSLNRDGTVQFGGQNNYQLFKDLSLRPYHRAGGLCLDSRNVEVFKTGLAMDYALRQTVEDSYAPSLKFVPPGILFGFPANYQLSPEWRQPMQDAVVRVLHPDSPTLKCLLSPGGIVRDIARTKDQHTIVTMERMGHLIQIRMPNWVRLEPHTKVDRVVHEGVPLAELPRAVYSSIGEVTGKYPPKSLEWLTRRIMDDLTEIHTVNESIRDGATGEQATRQTSWRCVPAEFARYQSGRSLRQFVDFRKMMGRLEPQLHGGHVVNEHMPRVAVLVNDAPPTANELKFKSGDKDPAWYADFVTPPTWGGWPEHCPTKQFS